MDELIRISAYAQDGQPVQSFFVNGIEVIPRRDIQVTPDDQLLRHDADSYRRKMQDAMRELPPSAAITLGQWTEETIELGGVRGGV
ncbi:hypothetical protein AB0I53_19395 [Saccharopolyspora sp. NPDC050389]|uniref:hypothetical protein n=1 Tax=Saccharopolyspora sp. NPDC050389 TaxID=3155516 RepID=UPI0033DCB218